MDPITAIIVNIIIGIILTAATTLVQQALTPPQRNKQPGVRGSLDGGGNNPLSFIVGTYATAGQLEYAGTWGTVDKTPNAKLVHVISVSDLPITSFRAVYVDSERHTAPSTGSETEGFPFPAYEEDGKSHLWARFFLGTQTTASSYLTDKFGSDSDRPYKTDMSGRGVAYAIMTARVNRELFSGIPSYLFEVDGIKLYDPRQDSTAGGSGTQRLNDQSTWAFSDNPVTIVYNILLGIRYGTEWVFGLQGMTQARLPYANWAAAMNRCDALITNKNGSTEKRFRCGMEIKVDQEPIAVIEELLKGCNGRMAEVGGVYKILVGEPAAPVWSFTDEDIVISEGQSYEPFPGLEATFNAVTATYPEPDEAWENKEAPPRYSSALEAEDGGRRLPAQVEFNSVPYRRQVQRLMRAMAREQRRFRRHSLTMPPEWWELEPLDAVEWTSVRNGYEDKVFLIAAMDDLPSAKQIVALQEQDASDYDWEAAADEFDTEITPILVIRPPSQVVVGFSVEPAIAYDSGGIARRPTIQLNYDGDQDDISGIAWQVRLAASDALTSEGVITDFAGGSSILSPVYLPDTLYEARIRYLPIGKRKTNWSNWLPVTTSDVRLTISDVEAFDEFAFSGLVWTPNSPATNSVAWTAGSVSYGPPGGTATTMAISAGSAAWTAGTLYVYYIEGATVLNYSTNVADVFTSGGVLVGVYKGGTNFVAVEGRAYVDGGMLLATTVGTTQLAAGAVTAGKIDAGAVTATKLAADAVVAGKIAADAIDTSSLFVDGVAITRVIADNAVSNAAADTQSGTEAFGGAEETIVSATLDPNGGRVIVQCFITMMSFSESAVQVRLKRGGTTVAVISGITLHTEPSTGVSLGYIDTDPGTTSRTWSMTVQRVLGDDANCVGGFIQALNTKK